MFERFTQWMRSLWDGQKPLQTITAARTESIQPIIDFIARTRMGSPNQAAEMGILSERGVTPEQFVNFCNGFGKGVAYVAKRFGTCPKAIVITDEDTGSPHYNSETQNIFLPRKYIYYMVLNNEHRQSKTEPYILSTFESAVIYGIEESYHHYQMTKLSKRYADLPSATIPGDTGYTEGYDNHPFEYDAERIVRQAIIELGYDKRMFQMEPGLHPWTWQECIEKQNSQQPIAQATR